MSEEFIRKSEVLKLLNEIGGCGADDEYFKGWDKAIDGAYRDVEDMKPVNAVELPCKVGDTLYIITPSYWTDSFYLDIATVKEITINECKDLYVFVKGTRIATTFTIHDFGKKVFLTREEAERALEELKNDK